MKVVIAYRNGEERLRVPAEVRNGVLRNGKNILINSDFIPAGEKDRIVKQIKAGSITPEIEKMGMKIGDNGNGLIVRWAEDVERECREKARKEYDALPADERAAIEERREIDRLYMISDQALNRDTDDDNVSRGYSRQAQADRRLAAWRVRYPKQARLEEADKLEHLAVREDDLASGALVYDADGWISPEEQQKRHDEHKDKAARLRAEAQGIRKEVEAHG